MNVFNQLKTKVQESQQLLTEIIKEYILLIPESKQLTLKKRTVLLFCKQAVSRVEQLESLETDLSEGLVATVEHKKVQVKINFTPEKITLNENSIERELRLLTPPQFQTDSIVYRYLIAGWQNFLGGKISNGKLPEGVRVKDDKVYYTLPRNQSQLIEALFSSLKNESALITSLKQGELMIETSVALSWSNFDLQKLFQLFDQKLAQK